MRYDFPTDIARWNTLVLFYIESPGFIIFPPTRAAFDMFVHRMTPGFGHNLQRLVVRCGYGEHVDDDYDNGDCIRYQTLERTPWEGRTEGVNDYFLPGDKFDGGVYEVRRGSDGNLVGIAGLFAEECGWVDDYETTFNF
jgi:hypothetical protein